MKNWKKPFYTITVGQSISLIGSSAVQFTLIWWLAAETASPLMLGFAGMMAFLPQLLLGPFVGVWVDRLSRKKVAVTADVLMGVAAAFFALLFYIYDMPYWTVSILLLVRAIGGVFHTPAIQSIVPMLVPKEKLMQANGISQFLQSGAFLLGPVIGALMYSALPIPFILLTDLVGALFASLTLAVFKIPEPEKKIQQAHFIRELLDGVKIFKNDKRLGLMMICVMLCMIFYLPMGTLYPLVTSSFFSLSAIYGSVVECAYAVGMVLASLVMSMLGNVKNKFAIAFAGIVGMGAVSFVCGILPNTIWAYWAFVVLCAALGGGSNVFGVPMMAYMQETIEPQSLGRAFSLWGSATSAAMPIGLLIASPLAEKFGVMSWFFISGIGVTVIGIISIFAFSKIKH